MKYCVECCPGLLRWKEKWCRTDVAYRVSSKVPDIGAQGTTRSLASLMYECRGGMSPPICGGSALPWMGMDGQLMVCGL